MPHPMSSAYKKMWRLKASCKEASCQENVPAGKTGSVWTLRQEEMWTNLGREEHY